MIFFGKDIINNIIDTSELEDIVEKIDQYKNDLEMLLTYFVYPTLNLCYIQNLLKYESNQAVFYCMDDVFNIRRCSSCIVYSRQYNKKTESINYYLMIICTQECFRNLGYARKLLDGFVENIKKETKETDKSVKIVLSSVDETVSFYQRYGFEVVDCSLENYPYLRKFEKCDPNKICTVMEFQIK